MELYLLQILAGFGVGLLVGIIMMLLFNKIKSGSASPASIKQDFDDYKNEVESHFEETSKKFKSMTDQYQDLYTHLSVGATSLCRPDSVAAALVDGSDPAKPAQLEAKAGVEGDESVTSAGKKTEQANDDETPSVLESEQGTVKSDSSDSNAIADAESSTDSASVSDKQGKSDSGSSLDKESLDKEISDKK